MPASAVLYSTALAPRQIQVHLQQPMTSPLIEYRASAHKLEELLPDSGREVAFVGRSNAGKSSAINALANRHRLAFVSKTPGRTQTINFFSASKNCRWVDLPGYGFAKVSKQERAHWVAAFESAGVPCGPINSIAEAFADPQVQHRGMLFDLPHTCGTRLPQVASPIRFTEAPLKHEAPPPLLGQHTEEILRELNFGSEEIRKLSASGVI